MKKMTVAGKIITKILEVLHWACAGLMALLMLLSYGKPGTWEHTSAPTFDYTVYGFSVDLADSAGGTNPTAFYLFLITAAILCVLMAMIFHDIYSILKKAEERTPFHEDNIRKLKEIGYLSIAVPIVGLVMSTIMRLALGPDAVEIGGDIDGFVMGIIVLCLTQYFAYGAQLEKDVDGLV